MIPPIKNTTIGNLRRFETANISKPAGTIIANPVNPGKLKANDT
ncbi:MAG: hypothetical protein ABFS56_10040 [Pseudomonadota bacterium]